MSEFTIIMESLNKKIENLEMITVQSKGRMNPVLTNNIEANPVYAQNLAGANNDIEKLAKSLQSISFGDKLTLWLGLFDKSYKDLVAKKSDILKKLDSDIKGYTYDRHWWNYVYRRYYVDNIFYMINNILGNTQYMVRNLSGKSAADLKSFDTEVSTYYKWVDDVFEKYLHGKKKGALKTAIFNNNLGDGYQVRMHKKLNMQDDPVQLRDCFDFIEAIQEVDFVSARKFDKAAIKDLENKIKSIITDFNTLNKQNNASAKTYGVKYIKTCNTYVGLLCTKLDEFYNADIDTLKTEYDEMVKVLNGLYNYKGE